MEYSKEKLQHIQTAFTQKVEHIHLLPLIYDTQKYRRMKKWFTRKNYIELILSIINTG